MSKAYFRTITTTGDIPNFAETAQKHNEKLQNYLKYGIVQDGPGIAALGPQYKPEALGGTAKTVGREVEHMEAGMILDQNSQRYCFWTTLCCEDEEEGE
jgi:hypothetical protein